MSFLILAALQGCQSYDARDAYAGCTSEEVISDGTVILTTYEGFGWPIREEVREPGVDPVIRETEYVYVVDRVVQSITTLGPMATLRDYDAWEHLKYWESNVAGDDGTSCSLTYQGDGVLETSDCENGVVTHHDACDNPISATTPEGPLSYGYTYDDCRILNSQLIGADAGGAFVQNTQYFAGRVVSWVREQGGEITSSITTYDCPAPVDGSGTP